MLTFDSSESFSSGSWKMRHLLNSKADGREGVSEFSSRVCLTFSTQILNLVLTLWNVFGVNPADLSQMTAHWTCSPCSLSTFWSEWTQSVASQYNPAVSRAWSGPASNCSKRPWMFVGQDSRLPHIYPPGQKRIHKRKVRHAHDFFFFHLNSRIGTAWFPAMLWALTIMF